MTRNIMRRLMAIVVLGSGILGFSAGRAAGTVSARPLIEPAIFVLHGSGAFSTAEATAMVARLSTGRFSLLIFAHHLPAPDTLHVPVARHIYVAWLMSGRHLLGPTRLALKETAGTYVGQGTITARSVTAVIITAEPAARMSRPALPALTVLASAGVQALHGAVVLRHGV